MTEEQLALVGLSKLDQAFAEFHAAHPEVYDWLHDRAVELVEHGHTRLGIKMLWESLRHETLLGNVGGEYRLNNNLTSRYARLLMQHDPRLDGVFDTRELHDREEEP